MITPTQMRAARAMLDLSQGEVAKSLGIAANTLSNIESGKTDVPASRLKEMQAFYEGKGVEFTVDEGVKRSTYHIQVYNGVEGFRKFYDDLYDVAKTQGGEFCVNNVSEAIFDKWHGSQERLKEHVDRMAAVIRDNPDFRMRIIIQEDDMNFRASKYAQYKWASKDKFSDISFYVYGDKLAILIFEDDDVYITVMPNKRVAEAYRKQFNMAWEMAHEPVTSR